MEISYLKQLSQVILKGIFTSNNAFFYFFYLFIYFFFLGGGGGGYCKSIGWSKKDVTPTCVYVFLVLTHRNDYVLWSWASTVPMLAYGMAN